MLTKLGKIISPRSIPLHNKWVFHCSLGFLIAGQFGVLLTIGTVKVYLFDVFLGFIALLQLFSWVVRRELVLPKYLFGFYGFTVLAALALVLNPLNLPLFKLISGGTYLARLIGYLLSGVYLYDLVRLKRITIHEVISGIVFFGVIFALLGYVQLLFLPDFRVLPLHLGWDPHINRLTSTFLDPNFAGAFIGICLAYCLYAYYEFKSLWWASNKLLALCGAFLFVSVFLTFSRSAWLLASVVVIIFGLFKDKRLLLFYGLFVCFAFLFVPRTHQRIASIADTTGSAQFRLGSWERGVTVAKDHLAFGVGFNTYKYAQQQYSFISSESNGHSDTGIDSSLLFVLATTGIMGLVVFVLSAFNPVYALFDKFRFVKQFATFDLVLLGVILGLFLESFFVNSLFYPQILFLWITTLVLYSFKN